MGDESSEDKSDLCDYERKGTKCCCNKIVCYECHKYHEHKDCVMIQMI